MRAVVAVEDAVVDADVEVVAVVMDLLAIVRTVDLVRIVETVSVETVRPAVDVEMDPAVEAVEDLVVEEAAGARKNSAWTRRLSLPWDKTLTQGTVVSLRPLITLPH